MCRFESVDDEGGRFHAPVVSHCAGVADVSQLQGFTRPSGVAIGIAPSRSCSRLRL